ncbi:MAG: hypothetical protein KAX65_01870 [Caldilineaceae bacterium]|nr:hypothetical protein [Caldilineaceae bacterium]
MKAGWLAWILCGAVAIATVAGISGELANGAGQDSWFEFAESLMFRLLPLEFALVAALILARQPRNAIGWLLLGPASLGPLAAIAESILLGVTEAAPATTVPLLLAVWFDGWAWLLLIFPILLIPLLFPTGRPPSPRWRWVVVYALVLASIFVGLGSLTRKLTPMNVPAAWSVENPLGIIPDYTFFERYLLTPWLLGLGILTVLCVAALFVRYRRAAFVEREQIKWLWYACAVFGVVYVLGLPIGGEEQYGLLLDIWNLCFNLSLMAIPAAIAIAILRYRLWDIDVIIRKTLVYSALTGLLALVFFGSVILLQRGFEAVTGQQSQLAIVLSTLAIAALFNPLRTRIQGWIDRRFYRKKYDAQQVLAAFAITARDETDMTALTSELARTVQETMAPERVSVWLKEARR